MSTRAVVDRQSVNSRVLPRFMSCKQLASDGMEAIKIAKAFEAGLNSSFISVSIRAQVLEKLVELSSTTGSDTAAINEEKVLMWPHLNNFVLKNTVPCRGLLSSCNALDPGNIKLPRACHLLALYQHAE
jgi:hypothetical protein